MMGERIKAARHMAGLSQRALAERVGVSAMTISKYERGLALPDSQMLIRLSQALGRPVEYFLRPIRVSVGLPAYRKRHNLPRKAEQAILAQVEEWLERYLTLEALFPEECPRFRLPEGWPRLIHNEEEVEEAALDLRRAWGLGEGPLENLAEWLEDIGIKVGVLQTHDRFDALTLVLEGQTPVMVVRAGVPGDRERFSLAHELGHLVLQAGEGLDEERLANRFAGAFLVPRPAVVRELGLRRQTLHLQELHLLKHKYGLSMQAWVLRARDVGILQRATAQRLFQAFRQRGWHLEEPGDPYPFEEPQRLQRLVIRAWVEGLISETRASELLGEPLSAYWQREGEKHALRFAPLGG
ncbi:MAG: helix-turn-helix domain-containing protein [Caldilineae bacterium]|nr:MAG: helix-turn-helix domain-containing protein [Caldilineae bacterium]